MAEVAQIFLIRHGTTEWSATGRHTSRTDVPLSTEGHQQAALLRETLRAVTFARIFTSPLLRARQTCELAGFGDRARVDQDLHEWAYGSYEGRTSGEIHTEHPQWNLFNDGCPGGESPVQVSQRADRVLARFHGHEGITAVFSHGHFLRVLAMRWMGWTASEGQRFVLNPASISVLGLEHPGSKIPALCHWNAGSHGISVSGA